jgi:hypothetical protein
MSQVCSAGSDGQATRWNDSDIASETSAVQNGLRTASASMAPSNQL